MAIKYYTQLFSYEQRIFQGYNIDDTLLINCNWATLYRFVQLIDIAFVEYNIKDSTKINDVNVNIKF